MRENEIAEYFSYNAETGEIRWRKRPFKARICVGDIAGSIYRTGYRMTSIGGRRIKVARLAWFLYYGRWPGGLIDHRNHIRTDDRISNLREATSSQNNGNQSLLKRNTSGFKGVSKTYNGKWAAYIRLPVGNKRIGTFETPELAHEAYRLAAELRFGEFANVA